MSGLRNFLTRMNGALFAFVLTNVVLGFLLAGSVSAASRGLLTREFTEGTVLGLLEADTATSREIKVVTSSFSNLADQNAFIQSSLSAVKSTLVFGGYCKPGDSTPSPVAGKAYLATESGIIFGTDVSAMQFLVGNGQRFDALTVSAVADGVVLLPAELSSSFTASSIDFDSNSVGLAQTTDSRTDYSFSIIPGQTRDSLSVSQIGTNYAIQSDGTTTMLSASYSKTNDTAGEVSELTVLNQRAGNNLKVINQPAGSASAAEGVDYGTDADYFVSSSEGDDANNGLTPETPKKTLAAVSRLIMIPGVKVALKAGDIFRETLRTAKSGTNTKRVVYGAYGVGRRPIVTGTEVLSGWSYYKSNIYRIKVANVPNQLIVDGVLVSVSRLPKEGYFPISSALDVSQFTSNSLDQTIDYSGAIAFIRNKTYSIANSKVLSSSGQTIKIDENLTLSDRCGFVLMNKVDFITQANEWCYDASGGYVYLSMDSGEKPSTHVIEVVTRESALVIRHDYNTVEDIDVLGAKYAGLYIYKGVGSIVRRCDIKYGGRYGIKDRGQDSPNSLIEEVSVSGSWGVGIVSSSTDCNVRFCDVTKIGLPSSWSADTEGSFGNGIVTMNSASTGSTIEFNKVEDVGYLGISFYCTNTTIRNNYINNAMCILDDGGGIYTYQGEAKANEKGSSGSVISGNIIVNIRGSTDGWRSDNQASAAIYMDDLTNNVTIENNIIYNATMGIYLHIADNIAVNNNLVVNCVAGLILYHQKSPSTFYKNMVVTYDKSDQALLWLTKTHQYLFTCVAGTETPNISSSIYIDSYHLNGLYYKGSKDFITWKSTTNQDQNSVFLQIEGEPQLFYNETQEMISIDLSSGSWMDYKGVNITSMNLNPFAGTVLFKK
ncbi:right-handed parallel beta-helix repeat-containing protein [Mangrovibacterium lignilyticum]|uniref:right-handed parallel beta-helix repeat-containing protein n=1 Tax=Mangrovibacterium lignilyticum TaxID=2668052 RepID=UPI0013CFEFC2|nr:right-handed parallel beta-helix repeat-containing protein [Mangrovibacterium lignilyticum]